MVAFRSRRRQSVRRRPPAIAPGLLPALKTCHRQKAGARSSMVNPAAVYRALHDLNSYLPKRFFDGWARPPLRVAFILTHLCNLRCTMCNTWGKENPKEIPKQLTAREIAHIIKQLPRYALLTFTGGEIYLRKDFREILTYACSRNRVHLVTNGTTVGPDDADEILDLSASNMLTKGIVSVGVSLDGLKESHDQVRGVPGAFEKSVAFLRSLVEKKRDRGGRYPIIDIKVVITPETVEVLPDLFKLGDEVGVDLVSCQILNTQSSSYGVKHEEKEVHRQSPPPVPEIAPAVIRGSLEAMESLAAGSVTQLRFNPNAGIEAIVDHYQNRLRLAEFDCTTVWSVMHVGPHGDVFPCYSYSMGNLKEKSVKEVWNGDKYRAFRKELKSAGVFPGCVGCCVMKPKSSRRPSAAKAG